MLWHAYNEYLPFVSSCEEDWENPSPGFLGVYYKIFDWRKHNVDKANS